MPKRKPQGWPKLMFPRRLKTGATAYYWTAPTWAVKAGYHITCEALGTDYAAAKQRCDDVLNKQFDCWRTRGDVADNDVTPGTFDWMVSVYKTSPKYAEKPAKTRKSYDSVLKLIS